jgi:arginine repressor
MKYPIRNLVYEKISQARTTTDTDLMNALQKEGLTLADSDFNKTLMDLEIYGLVRVSWLTKDKRRIELVADSKTPS